MKVTLCDWHEPSTVTTATYHVLTERTGPPVSGSPMSFPIDLCDSHFEQFMAFVDAQTATAKGIE